MANTETPTRRRATQCSGCPFRPDAIVPPEVAHEVARRIAGGERWVCHQSCDGALLSARSVLCAGAPPPPDVPVTERQVWTPTDSGLA